MPMDIAGQYFGTYRGTTTGQDGEVIVNLDKRSSGFSGSVAVMESHHEELPHSVYFITLFVDEQGALVGHADLQGLYKENRGRLRVLTTEQKADLYPDATTPNHITLRGQAQGNTLNVEFSSNDGTAGRVSVQRKAPGKNSIVKTTSVSWGAFKEDVASKHKLEIYRGQRHASPLRTSFHRRERYDLIRFEIEDAERLERNITSATDVQFQRSDSRMYVALLGIAQHHGYPTPLLDWTRSPYIAAYFAVRDAAHMKDSKPTIFCFDQLAWNQRNPSAENITELLPNIALVEPLPLKNPRVVPQQSVLMYCNIDDFESHVKNKENEYDTIFLRAYQIDESPSYVLQDLRKMGVYAGSLFPGLDGACRGVYEESIEV